MDESFNIPTSDGKTVRVNIEFSYRFDEARVSETFAMFKGKSGEAIKDSFIKVLICIAVSIVSIALIILTMIMPIVWSIKLHNPAFLLLWCIPAGIFVGVWAYQEFFDF